MTVAERFEIERVIAETIVADPPEVEPTPGEIDRRVLDGTAWLDEHVPGWADRIVLGHLRLSSSRYCVLGQLYGDYSDGVRTFWDDRDIDWETAGLDAPPRRLGFLAAKDETCGISADYGVLQRSWERVIRERQCRR